MPCRSEPGAAGEAQVVDEQVAAGEVAVHDALRVQERDALCRVRREREQVPPRQPRACPTGSYVRFVP